MGAATPVLRNTGPVVSCVAAGSLIVPLVSDDGCGTHLMWTSAPSGMAATQAMA
jgi:hypothetical protein